MGRDQGASLAERALALLAQQAASIRIPSARKLATVARSGEWPMSGDPLPATVLAGLARLCSSACFVVGCGLVGPEDAADVLAPTLDRVPARTTDRSNLGLRPARRRVERSPFAAYPRTIALGVQIPVDARATETVHLLRTDGRTTELVLVVRGDASATPKISLRTEAGEHKVHHLRRASSMIGRPPAPLTFGVSPPIPRQLTWVEVVDRDGRTTRLPAPIDLFPVQVTGPVSVSMAQAAEAFIGAFLDGFLPLLADVASNDDSLRVRSMLYRLAAGDGPSAEFAAHGLAVEQQMDAGIRTLIDLGIVDQHSPMVADALAAVAALHHRTPAASLPERLKSRLPPPGVGGSRSGSVAVDVELPMIAERLVFVEGLSLAEGALVLTACVSPDAEVNAGRGLGLPALWWDAEDDHGRIYPGSSRTGRTFDDYAESAVVFAPALDPRAEQLVIRCHGATSVVAVTIPVDALGRA